MSFLNGDNKYTYTRFFFHKQPTILIVPQRCLAFCDFQGNLLLSCCLIFIKKIWILKLQGE